jgi:DNA repair protein RecO (recombination protein O)
LKSYTVEAFVLRLRPLGEADRALTLFSRERGKVHAAAKGARKTQSKFAGRLDFFRRAFVTLHAGRSLDVVTGVSSVPGAQPGVDAWQHLVQPDAFALASYAAEVIDALSEPDLAVPDLFELLCELQAGIGAGLAVAPMAPAVDLRLLAALGLAPELDACARCGSPLGNRPLSGGRATLSTASGGLVCRRCAIEETSSLQNAATLGHASPRHSSHGRAPQRRDLVLHVSSAELRALRALRNMPLASVAEHAEFADLRRITRAFVEYQLGRRSKALGVDDAHTRRRPSVAAR